jgi:predicted AAA+ superfamily ATPase
MPGRRAAALLGPRQVGKTTLLLQLVDELLERGWPPGNITFFDFSDERLVTPDSPREVAAIPPVGLSSEYPRVYLFDEIQNAPDWQKWLKAAVDESRRSTAAGSRFIVTGSAAASLRHGGVQSGQGRWDEIPIEGLTLAEFIRLGSPREEDTPLALMRDPRPYERYREVGGFPEHLSPLVSTREAQHRIRDDIAGRAILRDLLQTGLDVERLRRLFVCLVNGSGNTWNQAKLARDLEANPKSVAEWMAALEDTRLIVKLDRDRSTRASARAQLRPQPKVYASDHGLITAFSAHPSPIEDPDIRARVFEAAVFRHLREVARAEGGALSYGRLDDDLEVDFIVRYAGHSVGIEVTSSAEAKPRKLSRAAQAMREIGIDRKILVHGGPILDLTGDIKLVPLPEFLLTPERYVGGEK